ncbi:MAG: PP2C family protein-serine/threonine phosphatase [Lepagella sp.]
MKITYWNFCECGPRRRNEDYARVVDHLQSGGFLAVLCDGMGGHRNGDVASKVVADSICEYWKRHQSQEDWSGIINAACNETMVALNAQSKGEMGTTMALVCISDDEVVFAHSGDSRVYHIRHNQIIYKSVDHISITPEGWPIICRAFYTGTDTYLPEIVESNLQHDDRIFICSDGVYGGRKEKELEKMLCESDCSIDALETLASSPAHDNFSGILIEIG